MISIYFKAYTESMVFRGLDSLRPVKRFLRILLLHSGNVGGVPIQDLPLVAYVAKTFLGIIGFSTVLKIGQKNKQMSLP